MAKVRPPAVAGQFYPGDARQLRESVKNFMATIDQPGPAPKAIIAPHAGYIFSGPVAGTAYAYLARANGKVRRIVLLGPAHWAHVWGLAASSAEAFATPLGAVPLDAVAHETILPLPQVKVFDDAHTREHCLEVQLPFLQALFHDFSLVPLAVGQATPAEVAEVIDCLWGGPETVVVISSDLSHYHNYQTARVLDQETSEAIEALQPLSEGQACGRNVINGLLHLARQRQLTVKTVDLRNSGDTAGSRDRVVGYGAYVFWEETAA